MAALSEDALALAEAAMPTTSSARLLALAEHPEAEVRRAVARNPGTPEEGLRRLIGAFPAEVLGNASFDLLLLASPGFFWTLEEEQAVALASSPCVQRCLDQFSEGMRRRASVQAALCVNPATPLPVLRSLLAQGALGVLENPTLPLSDLHEVLESDWTWGRAAAARSPRAEGPLLSLLRRAGSSDDLRWLREPRGAVSEEELARLVGGGVWSRRVAAAHPELGERDQENLAQDPSPAVRKQVARRENVLEAILGVLREDRSCAVRQAVAYNPRLPAPWRSELSQDPAPEVRKEAARSAACEPELLRRMQSDPEEDVRDAVEMVLRRRGLR